MEMKRELPDTLSELIMVALEDIKSLPESVSINMNMYVISYDDGSICSVCFAGAVMLKSLGEIRACMIEEVNRKKIRALNEIRRLDLIRAMSKLGINYVEGTINEFEDWIQKEAIEPLEGRVSKGETISTMTKVANWLKEKGL